ncbi:hypothetical protein ACO0QE_003637 [Hanseniaspora vineae]
MSLRSTKSLPNLKKAIRLDSFSGLPATPFCDNSFEVLQRKYVHHTNKNDHTILLTNGTNTNTAANFVSLNHPTNFSGLSLRDLKVQCRSRGLKVSGTKKDLISRLSTTSTGSIKQQTKKDMPKIRLEEKKITELKKDLTSKPARQSKKRKNVLSAKKTQDLSQKISQSVSSAAPKTVDQITNTVILNSAAQSGTSVLYSHDHGKLVSNTVFPRTSPRNIPQRVYMPHKLSLEVPDFSSFTISQDIHKNNALVHEPKLGDLLILKQLASGLSLDSGDTNSLIKKPMPSSSNKKDEPFAASTKPLATRDKVFFVTFVTSILLWWDILPLSLSSPDEKNE